MNTLYHFNAAHSVFDKYLSPKAMDIVIRYNFNTDYYSAIGWKALQYKVYPLFPVARYWYKNIDHFDEMNSSEEVLATWRHHRDLLMSVADDAKFPPNKLRWMLRILGRSSHALTDISSHTNYVHLMRKYYSTEAGPRGEVAASGKSVDDFLRDSGPSFGSMVNDAKFADFREKYLPELFAYQSIVDKGPRSHSESGVDSPKSTACANDPKLFEVSFSMSLRNTAEVVEALFEKLKKENSVKYKALTEAYRDVQAAAPGKYEKRSRWWAEKVGGWD